MRLPRILGAAVFLLILFTAEASGAVWAKRLDYYDTEDFLGRSDGSTFQFQPPKDGLVVDSAGNVFVAGNRRRKIAANSWDNDTAIAKYSPDGTRQWVRTTGAWGFTKFKTIKLDPSGNVVIVTERNTYDDGLQDWVFGFHIFKLSTNGNLLWTRKIDDPNTTWDEPGGAAIDASGNIYVAFRSTSQTGIEIRTLKYAPNGTRVWMQSYNFPHGADYSPQVAIDPLGNVYLSFRAYIPEYTAVTLKFNPAGALLWERRYPTIESYLSGESSIAIDPWGYVTVVVPGVEDDGSGNWIGHLLVLQYQPNGFPQWTRIYRRPGNSVTHSCLAIDPFGAVLIGAWSKKTTGNDYLLLKYQSSGNLIWERRYDGPYHSDDYLNGIAIDGAANIYVTGGSYSPPTEFASEHLDMVTIKYDTEGGRQWLRRYNGDRWWFHDDWGSAVAVVPDGNIVVGGTSEIAGVDSPPNAGFITIKYSP